MNTIVDDLRNVVGSFVPRLQAIDAQTFTAKPNPKKWSKQEVIGHLIDSAQSNLRRFVVGQYEDRPHIVYAQDFWVAANGYQSAAREDVIANWRLINERICNVLLTMPEAHYNRQVNTGKGQPEYHSLIWLAEDYVKHMKHHLNQVIPGSFEITYP